MNFEDDSYCIVCGEDNPLSLQLDFEHEDDEKSRVMTEFTPGEELSGFRGVVHGGIISTLLDEAMAKSIYLQGWQAVTAEMTVRYVEPVNTGETLRVLGWIQEQRRRIIETSSRIENKMGDELARAKARFVLKGKRDDN
ncbi:PaaI family thioesterase [Halarsenatibacter silvermanii]|uniref:Uncharacterized domain 1-containing protein n=1 Tax=Halarsenatibacter silvermanii TaxID=321763 RepID=A0A1G9RNF7_9FIRM|nr:PaaI family thioesterase [Halarsenatibacter silvermanii]SDM24839.1 uncharacterized domain 1-containing protein [Halarsenatibacter silvermanii]